ncbi:MAG TPA: hypothetical protein VNZ22_18770, partial [Bacillota bacterium]|nr:hypothetical protein [Bacillota bacterium]
MHLPFIQAPVRPEAPEGLSPSATSAKSPGSTAAFFATCMDHALAHSQAPQGRAGETEKPRPKPFALTHPAKAGQTGDTSAKEGRGVKPLVAPPAVWTHTGRPLHEPTAARNPATLPPTVVPHLAPETGSVPAQPPRPTAQPQGESPQAAPE